MVRIAISGASGRMGRAMLAASVLAEFTDLAITDANLSTTSNFIGQDINLLCADLPHSFRLDADYKFDLFDVLIDFTSVENSLKNIDLCVKHKKGLVLGTTGFSQEQLEIIEQAATQIPIFFTSNMSFGIYLVHKLLSQVINILGKNDYYDIEIIEAHHKHKIDAPSGTALSLGETISKELNFELRDKAVYSRFGTNNLRVDSTIGFATIRAGDIVGEHSVIFGFEGERIEITHKATSRLAFARGALQGSRLIKSALAKNKVGLFNMNKLVSDN